MAKDDKTTRPSCATLQIGLVRYQQWAMETGDEGAGRVRGPRRRRQGRGDQAHHRAPGRRATPASSPCPSRPTASSSEW